MVLVWGGEKRVRQLWVVAQSCGMRTLSWMPPVSATGNNGWGDDAVPMLDLCSYWWDGELKLANLVNGFDEVGQWSLLQVRLLLGATGVLTSIDAVMEGCYLDMEGLCCVLHAVGSKECLLQDIMQCGHEVQCSWVFCPVLHLWWVRWNLVENLLILSYLLWWGWQCQLHNYSRQ